MKKMRWFICLCLGIVLSLVISSFGINECSAAVFQPTGDDAIDGAIEFTAVTAVGAIPVVGGPIGYGIGMASDVNGIRENKGLTSKTTVGKIAQSTSYVVNWSVSFVAVGAGIAGLISAPISGPVAGGCFLVSAGTYLLNTPEGGRELDRFINGVEDVFGSIWNGITGIFKTPEGVNCYKPNIYLYSEEERDVRLSFGRPQLLIDTIPSYHRNWDATVHGHTITVEDKDYDYLFYESITDPRSFSYDEGFFIDHDHREESFSRILTAYGFNAKEREDFLSFWVEKLEDGVDFWMFPQMTESVDQNMPLAVYPKPKTSVRIWFAFVENNLAETVHLNKAKEPSVKAFERSDFTLVEWGGFIVQ